MPSVTPSTGSDRCFDTSSDSSPSTSAESSPVGVGCDRRFQFPAADENMPPAALQPIPSVHRKRMGQLATLAAMNDLRSAYTDDGATLCLQLLT